MPGGVLLRRPFSGIQRRAHVHERALAGSMSPPFETVPHCGGLEVLMAARHTPRHGRRCARWLAGYYLEANRDTGRRRRRVRSLAGGGIRPAGGRLALRMEGSPDPPFLRAEGPSS